jgi:hypothetical protein
LDKSTKLKCALRCAACTPHAARPARAQQQRRRRCSRTVRRSARLLRRR